MERPQGREIAMKRMVDDLKRSHGLLMLCRSSMQKLSSTLQKVPVKALLSGPYVATQAELSV